MSTPSLFLAIPLILGLLLLFGAISWLMSLLGGVQFVQTPPALFSDIVALARLKPGDNFVELGSGTGGLCRFIAQKTAARTVGIDINPLLTFYAKWQARRYPGVSFILGNYRSYHLGQADVAYCYLLSHLMQSAAKQFTTQMKSGGRVISYAFPLADKQPTKIIPATVNHGAVYLYTY